MRDTLVESLREIAALHDRIEANQAIPAYPSERELLREAADAIEALEKERDEARSEAMLGGDITHEAREAARHVTGGNCAFAIDDIALLAHLARRAVGAGLTDTLHPAMRRKAEGVFVASEVAALAQWISRAASEEDHRG